MGKNSNSEIGALHGLRGFAAIMVFVSHSANIGFLPIVFGKGAGHMGVMLFFVLSAFLITHLYFEKPPTKQNLNSYAIARFARVYPLYIVMILVSLLAYSQDVTEYALYATPTVLLENALLIGSFKIFWTISTEFQFYLLFSIMWFLSWKTDNPRRIALFCAGICLLLVFVDGYRKPSGNVFKTLHVFAVGVFVALIRERVSEFLNSKIADVILGISLLLFYLSIPLLFKLWTGISHDRFWSPYLLVLCFVIILTASVSDGLVARLLSSKMGILIGNLSFAIYLIHHPIMVWVNGAFVDYSPGLKFVISCVFTFALSWVTYKFFEVPVRQMLRNKFSRQTSCSN